MKSCCEPRAALAVLLLAAALWDSCSAAEDISNVSTTEYEPPCLSASYCRQAAACCPSAMDDHGWIAAAVGWSLWFLTLILLCVDKIMRLRPDEPKYLVA
ncbi:transmembrane protein 213 isoform X2 [Oenanthe melanoleuca]|uniref:transmembrane protein 213 isoform X2 n=1 Tax=Oenanthe melanoleuca TaxID=2939378 RepID=UPI0024C1CD8C|nr:transmembrane protein 213 isoform X2 [Oenanthe melanoleuca]